MIEIESVKKLGKSLFQVYVAIGIAAMGLLACCVIFAVIARYCFSLSWKQLEEFMTTLFAFTTWWGLGICVIQNEHVIIDILYDRIKPAIKRWLSVFNCMMMLVIDILLTYHSIIYVEQVGGQISQGMEIPMKYMYGIMPLSLIICAVCIVIKIVENIQAPINYFEPKNKEISDCN